MTSISSVQKLNNDQAGTVTAEPGDSKKVETV